MQSTNLDPANDAVEAMASVAPEASRFERVERLNRRRSPRQTLVAEAMLRSYDEPSKSARGYLSNISSTGVGFHSMAAVKIGSKYKIRIDLGPVKWAGKIRVVSCRPHDSGTFDVGAEFLEEAVAAAA